MMVHRPQTPVRQPSHCRPRAALGELMPYGQGTAYDTSSQRYVIVGQPGSFATPAELNAALYAAEAAFLSAQQPQVLAASSSYPGMASYPPELFRTLPGGQVIAEATYQQALQQGSLADLLHLYTGYGGALPTPLSTPSHLPATPATSTPQPSIPPTATATPQPSTLPAVYQPRVSLINLSRAGQPPQVGDTLRVEITGGPPNQAVTATAIHNGQTSTSELGRTDGAGRWSKDVQMSDAETGTWVEHWRVGNTPATPTLEFQVSARPTPQPSAPPTVYHPRVSLTNLSRAGQSPQVGDTLRVEITAAPPNQTVTATAVHNGQTSTSEQGKTDDAGRWSKDVQMSAAEIGTWVQHWRVGNTPATPTLEFTVAARPTTPPATTAPTPTTGGETGEPTTPPGQSSYETFLQQTRTALQKVPWYVWPAAAALLLWRWRT